MKDGAAFYWHGTGGQSLYSLKHSVGALVHPYYRLMRRGKSRARQSGSVPQSSRINLRDISYLAILQTNILRSLGHLITGRYHHRPDEE